MDQRPRLSVYDSWLFGSPFLFLFFLFYSVFILNQRTTRPQWLGSLFWLSVVDPLRSLRQPSDAKRAGRHEVDPMPPTRVPLPFISFHFFWRMFANKNKWQLWAYFLRHFFLFHFFFFFPPFSPPIAPVATPIGDSGSGQLSQIWLMNPETLSLFLVFILFYPPGGNDSDIYVLKGHYLRDFHRANSCLFFVIFPVRCASCCPNCHGRGSLTRRKTTATRPSIWRRSTITLKSLSYLSAPAGLNLICRMSICRRPCIWQSSDSTLKSFGYLLFLLS